MRRPRSPRRSGMTLIEVMISVAILSLVLVMIWQGFSQTMRNKQKLEEGIDRNHIITATLDRMARELSMAYVSIHENPSPSLVTSHTAFVGIDRSGGDRVDFTSFSHQRLYRDAHESDQNELSYFVMRHPDDSSINVLARREAVRIDEKPQEGGRIEILLEGVRDFQLEYLDPNDMRWLNAWTTEQAVGQAARLPAQVKISLTVPGPNGRGEVTYATRVSLPMRYALNHAIYIRR